MSQAPPVTAPEAIKFWARVRRGAGCWTWAGTRNPRGYGKVYLREDAPRGSRGRMHYAHRVAFLLTAGLWPEGVLHRCDNPPCVNPGHLFPGDQSINMIDCTRKGRLRPRGRAYSEACCPSGHERTQSVTHIRPDGRVDCLTCRKASRKPNGKAEKAKR